MKLFKEAAENNFIKSVEKKPKTDDELMQAFYDWKDQGDDKSFSNLLRKTDPIISSAINTYGSGLQDPTSKLEARLMVAKALPKYNPNKGAKLKTYLMSQLRPLSRSSRQRLQSLKLPEKVWYDHRNIETAEAEFKDSRGREPSIQELADKTGLSPKRIKHIKTFHVDQIPTSVARAPSPGYEGPMAQTELEDETSEIDFWTEAVYMSLPPMDQLIYDYRTGSHGKAQLMNKEIAKKLGASPSTITQKANAIADKIEQGFVRMKHDKGVE
jgi:DNA-directed RNA polymerase specialized sigma subunit